MSLNPFDLFNVSYKSSLEDLKKSFKNLSLLCHPDKGGSKEDMEVVYNSYVWVREQIENGDHGRTMEGEEEAFKKFMREQENIKIPSMYEIMTDGFNKRFNEDFERLKEKSNMVYEGEYKEEDFKDESDGVVVVYKEPFLYGEKGFQKGYYDLSGQVSDFTGGGAYDYKDAFVREKIIEVEESKETFEERLQKLKEEREKLVLNFNEVRLDS